MREIRLGKYVDLEKNYAIYGENGYYINPFIMVSMIVDSLELNMSFNQIREFVTNANVTVTEEEIKEYLNKKMDEEQPGLREKIEKYRSQTGSLITFTEDREENQKKIKASAENFKHEIDASRYGFDPYTLTYFKTYIANLKEKCLSLFEIYDILYTISKRREEISEEALLQLKEIDFHFNGNGDTYYEDVLRLATTIVNNVSDLYEKVSQANNVDTYLTFSVSLHSLRKDGIFGNEIYPKKEIQVRDLHYSSKKEFIPLTEHQKSILRQKDLEDTLKWMDEDFIEEGVSPEGRTLTDDTTPTDATPVLQKK